jgi:hypothetical protein
MRRKRFQMIERGTLRKGIVVILKFYRQMQRMPNDLATLHQDK